MNIKIDDELRLLNGSSFFINGIEIKPLTLNEIVNIGYTQYYASLNTFVLEVKDMFQEEIPEEFNELKIFDIFLNSGVHEILENFLKSISIFLKFDKFDIDLNNNIILLDDKILDRDSWDEICRIVKLQNCVRKRIEDEYNPANDHAREIIEKIRALKREHPIEEQVTLLSMISGLSWKANNINIFNVWDLTLYQLYDALNRLEIIDQFQFTFNGIYAGTVDGKKINMKDINWMKIIKN